MIPHCRVIISPHAGYKYCSGTLSPAFESLSIEDDECDLRVVVIGPSHHVYFHNKILLSSYDKWVTPYGDLTVDTGLISDWCREYGSVCRYMDDEVDKEEHSLEMQMPALYRVIEKRRVKSGGGARGVKIVPILVSHGDDSHMSRVGDLLYDLFMKEEEEEEKQDGKGVKNYVIVSSDFCHWGRRFDYTGYIGSDNELNDAMEEETEIEMLTSRSKLSHHQISIWQSIELLDRYGMKILSSMDIKLWNKYLDITENTICGRYPLNCLIYMLMKLQDKMKIHFGWLNYSQSNHVETISESSVSYSSGYVQMETK